MNAKETSEYETAYEARVNGNGTAGNSEPQEKQPPPDPWPFLAEEAYYGLPGEIVRAINPYTEADPVALLANLLVMFGNAINANAHFRVEYTKHFLRLFVSFVGETAKARKGQSFSTPHYLFSQVDPAWVTDCVTGGLSSGEGLIFQVRDPRYALKNGAEVLVDKGVTDKRLLLVEEELGGTLKVGARDGNSLSAILRQAWDRGDLRPLTKNDPIRATGAHISLIGHVTKDELLRCLSETDRKNGLANRFLWLLVRRSKVIPKPKGVPAEILQPLIERLRQAVDFARKVQAMDRDEEAEVLWEEVYPELSEGKPGLFGAIIARAEVQVMRLGCLYALWDCSAVVKRGHLQAALALWEYAEESAQLIFGDALGDPVADAICQALRQHPEGLTRTDISYLFGRNLKPGESDRALGVLLAAGKARREEQETGGRPAERWYAVTKKTKETK